MSVQITILPNGPALVKGDMTIVGVDGKPIAVTTPQVAICRCGQSKGKPFCDGSHRTSGFKDPAPTA